MKQEFIAQAGNKRLIMFFAGWGVDPASFVTLARPGYDILFVYDYRTTEFDELPTSDYDEICVIAWSFGVPAAAKFIAQRQDTLPITRCVAVAGTLIPVDDRCGIPEAIFLGTLRGLDERNLRKFYRRMCGSGEAFRVFSATAVYRSVGELTDELRAIQTRGAAKVDPHLFDSVYITGDDAIIPASNQRNAWAHHGNIHEIAAPHLPDFQEILNREFIDKGAMSDTFARGASTYDDNADAQLEISRSLLSIWRALRPEPGRTLEIGVGTGRFTRMYAAAIEPSQLHLWDISASPDDLNVERLDAETAIASLAPGSFDSIVGTSAIQWFNSPARFVGRCLRALAPGGVCVLSTFGPDNLMELRPYQGAALQYLSADAWRRLFPGATVSEERIAIGFDSPRAIIDHLRLTGVNSGARSRGIGATRALLASGLRSLTYHAVYLALVVR